MKTVAIGRVLENGERESDIYYGGGDGGVGDV